MYGKERHHEILSKQAAVSAVWKSFVEQDGDIRILKGKKRTIYRWDINHFRLIEEDDEMEAAVRWMPESIATPTNAKACSDMTKLVGRKFKSANRQDENIVLPLANGYIRVIVEGCRTAGRRGGRTCRFEWVKPDREAEKTHSIPIDIDQPHGTEYHPQQTIAGSRFHDDYLATSLADDEADYIQTFFGYSLLDHNNEQIGLFQYGNGGEGKSTIVNLCSHIHRKTVPVSMKKLGDFGLATASQASLIFVDDAPATWDNADVMKSVLSAGLMAIDVKHSDAIEGRVYGKMVVCGNEVPYVNDASNGWQRRWMLAKWTRQITKDTSLEPHIVSHELRHVMDWMLLGLKRYFEQGLPTIAEAPASTQELFAELVSANNTAAAWAIHAGAAADPTVKTDKKAIYDAYKAWGNEMEKSPKAMKDQPRFFIALRQHMKHFEEGRMGGRNDQRRYVGIRVPGIPHVNAPTIAEVIPIDPEKLGMAGTLDILEEALRKTA